jgi:hypothetical protein
MMIETKVQQTTPAMVENNTSKRKPASQRLKEEQQIIPDSATSASGKATRRLNKAERQSCQHEIFQANNVSYRPAQHTNREPKSKSFFYEEAKIFFVNSAQIRRS